MEKNKLDTLAKAGYEASYDNAPFPWSQVNSVARRKWIEVAQGIIDAYTDMADEEWCTESYDAGYDDGHKDGIAEMSDMDEMARSDIWKDGYNAGYKKGCLTVPQPATT